MEFRTFAKTDQKISLLGYGAWGIGKSMWIGADDAESKKSLHRAIAAGVNLIDTALVYGNGHSEKLVGEVERESGQKLFIASKLPSKKMEWPAHDKSALKDSFPKDYIILKTEQSLKNLRREYLDLQQFHVWNDNWAAEDDWKEAFQQLKQAGKVRHFGISVNDHQPENCIETARTGLIDALQVIFNIFDQSPADKLFPFCEQNKVSIIVRVPFDEGALTGSIRPDSIFPRGDWRHNYFRGDRKKEVQQRVEKIWADVKNETASLPEAALRYIISFPAVTTVIPGMRKEKHVLHNLASIARGPLPVPLVQKLSAHRWIRNFYQ